MLFMNGSELSTSWSPAFYTMFGRLIIYIQPDFFAIVVTSTRDKNAMCIPLMTTVIERFQVMYMRFASCS